MVVLLGLLGCYGWALAQAEREDAQRPVPDGSAAIRLVGLAAQTPQPLLLRLNPRDRARVLAALAALVILGFTLVALAWWGARYTRRYLKRPWPRSERQCSRTISEFDWAEKPLYGAPSDEDADMDADVGDRRDE
jgi:hypothetical protein